MIRIASVAALAASLVCVQAPAWAASPMTAAFMADVAANLAVLDTSSRLAQGRTESADLAAYAKDEAEEVGQVAIALSEAAPSDHRVASADAELLTGRSVAVAGMSGRADSALRNVAPRSAAPKSAAPDAAHARGPATATLATLKTLRGPAFDRLYFVTQLDALIQIESDYRTYLKHGDDPGIATMARQQLPGLMKRLEALTRM